MALISVLIMIALIAIIVAVVASLVNSEILSTGAYRDREIARQNALFGLHAAMAQLQEEAGPDQRVTARAEILNTDANTVTTGTLTATKDPTPAAAVGNALWTGVWKTSNPGTALTQNLDVAITGGKGIDNAGTDAAKDQGYLGDVGFPVRPWSYFQEKPRWLISAPSGVTPDPTQALSGSNVVTMANYQVVSGSSASTATVQAYLVPIVSGTATVGSYAYWVSDEGVKAKANLLNPWAQSDADANAGIAKNWLQNQLSFMAPQRTAIEKMSAFQNYPATKVQQALSGSSPLLATDWANFLGVTGLSGTAAVAAKQQHFGDVTFYSKGVLANARFGGLKTDLSAGFSDPNWKPLGTGGAGLLYSNGANNPIFVDNDSLFVNDNVGGNGQSVNLGQPLMGPSWSVLKSYGNLWKPIWWETPDPLAPAAEVKASAQARPGFSVSNNGAFNGSGGNRDNTFERQDLHAVPLSFREMLGLSISGGQMYLNVNPEVILWNPYNVPVRSGQWRIYEGAMFYGVGQHTAASRVLRIAIKKSNSPVWKTVGDNNPATNPIPAVTSVLPLAKPSKPDPGVDITGRKFLHGGAPTDNTLSQIDQGQNNYGDINVPQGDRYRNNWIDQNIDMSFSTTWDDVLQPGEIRRYALKQSVVWNTASFWPTSGVNNYYPTPVLVATNNFDGAVSLPMKSFDGIIYQPGDQLNVDFGVAFYYPWYGPLASLFLRDYSGRTTDATRVTAGSTSSIFKNQKILCYAKNTDGSVTYGNGTDPGGALGFKALQADLPWDDSPTLSNQTGSSIVSVSALSTVQWFLGFRGQTKALVTNGRSTPLPVLSQISLRRTSDSHCSYNTFSASQQIFSVPAGNGVTPHQSLESETYAVKAIGSNGPNTVKTAFDTVDATTEGYAYWGDSYELQGQGVHNIVMFDIPRQPLLSVGALMHANFNGHIGDPTYVVGSSLPNLFIPRSYRKLSNTIYTGLNPWVDLSHYLNETLFDGCFFSSVPPALNPASAADQQIDLTKYPPFVKFDQAAINSGTLALPNARMQYYLRSGSSPALADVQNVHKAAANLLVDGAFNVNSTSVEAWKALLGSLSQQAMAIRKADGSPQTLSGSQVNNPFPRLTAPTGAVNVSGGTKDWSGFRALTDAELGTLATQIVRQVKLRGPFLGLGDFVNRRLGSPSDYRTGCGALHEALRLAAVNNNLGGTTSGSNELQRIAEGPSGHSVGGLYTYKFYYANPDPNQATAAGQPAWLTQNDLLKVLAPVLTARSDTFVIRCLGEKKNPAGKVVSRAWCEAVVQRTPDYANTADAPETPVTSLTIPDNQSYGRRFEIVSFRWLNPNEI